MMVVVVMRMRMRIIAMAMMRRTGERRMKGGNLNGMGCGHRLMLQTILLSGSRCSAPTILIAAVHRSQADWEMWQRDTQPPARAALACRC